MGGGVNQETRNGILSDEALDAVFVMNGIGKQDISLVFRVDCALFLARHASEHTGESSNTSTFFKTLKTSSNLSAV